MPGQAEHRQVPSHANGAGAVLVPEVLRNMSDVFEPQLRAAVRHFGEMYIYPTDLASKLPGEREHLGWFAGGDLAAGISLQLVASSQPKIAGNRQEPARDPLCIGNGIPEILDVGIVGTGCDHHPGWTALVLAALDLAPDRANKTQDIDVRGVFSGHCERHL